MAAEEFKIDPFGHVADLDPEHAHFHIFDGLEFTLPGPKFAWMMGLVAVILLAVFLPLARRIASGEAPRGKLWNFLEWVLTFVRDQIARPGIGEHDYKRFLPFLWTLFLFILVMNLVGLVPFLASATASMAVTGALALVAFFVIHINGVKGNHGFMGYMKTLD